MGNDIFLIDTNIFIQPYNNYYPFDIAPQYWEFLKCNIFDKKIHLLDKVFEEIVSTDIKKDDELATWVRGFKELKIKHYENEIVLEYGNLLKHIQNSTIYKEKALESWLPSNVADPWLIATAKAFSYSVVTTEQSNREFEKAKSGVGSLNALKIPDVCQTFGVKCYTLLEMMREFKFSFAN